MKHRTPLEKQKLQKRPHCRGRVRADEQHQQPANNHERREHEYCAANRAGQMTGEVPKDVASRVRR